MDSKEDTSLTGFNSVSSDKTETETAVNDTNGAVNSVKTVDNNDNSIKDSGSSLNVVVDTDDETEGFASGEEEAFETANENLVVGIETLANGEEGEMFLEPSEFVVAKIDDDENDKLGFVEKKSEPNSSENEIEVVIRLVKRRMIWLMKPNRRECRYGSIPIRFSLWSQHRALTAGAGLPDRSSLVNHRGIDHKIEELNRGDE
ncbi:hypothetical protein Hdeb2414_s0008g00290691 [Helianthus debilis subsp. tardiflorus]